MVNINVAASFVGTFLIFFGRANVCKSSDTKFHGQLDVNKNDVISSAFFDEHLFDVITESFLHSFMPNTGAMKINIPNRDSLTFLIKK